MRVGRFTIKPGGLILFLLIVSVILWFAVPPIISIAKYVGGEVGSYFEGIEATQQAREAERKSAEATAAAEAKATNDAYEATLAALPTQTPFAVAGPSEDPADGMPVVTIGLDAFAPYYTPLLAKALHLDAKWGVDFEFVTFYSEDATSFDEASRSEMLTTGQWDVLFTTIDKLALRPGIGKLIASTDETDGADKLICNDSVRSLNDLKGKRISFLGESIGEFAVYYYLDLVKIPVTEVALVANFDGVAAYDDDGNVVGGAVYEFIQGRVDCVSGWEPDVDFALDYGGHIVIDTSVIRVALDVILISNNADTNRSAEIQAFFNANAEALKVLLDTPDQADETLYNWLVENQLDGDNWSFIYGPGDWLAWLETTPQATLADNVFVFRNVNTIAERLANACRVWKAAGFATPDCEPETYLGVINSGYVQAASSLSELATTGNPVNDSYLFTTTVDIPEITVEELEEQGDIVATLPFEKIAFLPNDYTLTAEAKDLLDESVCPVLQASPLLVLKLTGSAALPIGEEYSEQGSLDFARKRAQSVKDYLTISTEEGGCGIDPDRIVIDVVPPQYPRSGNPALLEQDRFVKFELVSTGY